MAAHRRLVIARGALLAACCAAALALACGQTRGVAAEPPDFDAARAFRDLEALVHIGPRPAGSNGAEQARALIRERLRQAGWLVESQNVTVAKPGGGTALLVNLVARRAAAPARTLLVTHYDTKNLAGIAFVGANDGASGAAVLLELARALAADSPPALELAFCDGEEAFGANIDAHDGLYGSKALAQRMAADGSLAKLERVILVDMVGDRDLNLATDLGSAEPLRRQFEAASAKLHFPPPFDPEQQMGVIDDHSPFQDAGVRDVLVLLDFQYGARSSPGPRWHTDGDVLDAVSADSLDRVGRPLLAMLRELDATPLARP